LYNKTSPKKFEGITSKKVILNMTEENKYLTIKKLVDTNGNKKRAAVKQ